MVAPWTADVSGTKNTSSVPTLITARLLFNVAIFGLESTETFPCCARASITIFKLLLLGLSPNRLAPCTMVPNAPTSVLLAVDVVVAVPPVVPVAVEPEPGAPLPGTGLFLMILIGLTLLQSIPNVKFLFKVTSRILA